MEPIGYSDQKNQLQTEFRQQSNHNSDRIHGRHALEPRSGKELRNRIQGFGSEPVAAFEEDSLWGTLVEVGIAMGVGTKEEMEESMVLAKSGLDDLTDAASALFDIGDEDDKQQTLAAPTDLKFRLQGGPCNVDPRSVDRPFAAGALQKAGRQPKGYERARDVDGLIEAAADTDIDNDAPGQYFIVSDDPVVVSDTKPLGGQRIGRLIPGEFVMVLGLSECPGRLRAHIAKGHDHPSGWISVVNLETGYRFAEPCMRAEKPRNAAQIDTPSANERRVNDSVNSDLLNRVSEPELPGAHGEQALLDLSSAADAHGDEAEAEAGEWTPFAAAAVATDDKDDDDDIFNDEAEWGTFESATGLDGNSTTLLDATTLASECTQLPNMVGAGLSLVSDEGDNFMDGSMGYKQPSRWPSHSGYAFDPFLERTSQASDPCVVKPPKFQLAAAPRGISVFDPLSGKNADCIAALGQF